MERFAKVGKIYKSTLVTFYEEVVSKVVRPSNSVHEHDDDSGGFDFVFIFHCSCMDSNRSTKVPFEKTL